MEERRSIDFAHRQAAPPRRSKVQKQGLSHTSAAAGADRWDRKVECSTAGGRNARGGGTSPLGGHAPVIEERSTAGIREFLEP